MKTLKITLIVAMLAAFVGCMSSCLVVRERPYHYHYW